MTAPTTHMLCDPPAGPCDICREDCDAWPNSRGLRLCESCTDSHYSLTVKLGRLHRAWLQQQGREHCAADVACGYCNDLPRDTMVAEGRLILA